VTLETVRAGPRANATTGSQNSACLATCSILNTEFGQGDLASRRASPTAIAAARDLVFEGLVETSSLAESYSRSLTEAAWRGDQSTVEVHLRQLRACVVTSIGIFKQLDGLAANGGQS
jgi:hypothetical protein